MVFIINLITASRKKYIIIINKPASALLPPLKRLISKVFTGLARKMINRPTLAAPASLETFKFPPSLSLFTGYYPICETKGNILAPPTIIVA